MTRGWLNTRPDRHTDVGDCPGCGYVVWHTTNPAPCCTVRIKDGELVWVDCDHATLVDRIWWHTRCHKTSINDRLAATVHIRAGHSDEDLCSDCERVAEVCICDAKEPDFAWQLGGGAA